MKKGLVLIAVLAFFTKGNAQQDPQFTQFMFDKLSINPGFAGTNDAYCFTGIWRNQWTGLNAGEPKTILINAHAPVAPLLGGVGLTYYNDRLGWENSNFIRLSYSYHMNNLGPGNLGIGASVGYFSKSYNAVWLTPSGGNGTGDNAIPTTTTPEGALDFSFGAYYYADKFYGGISATHLSQSQLTTLNVQSARHFYFMGGYNYDALMGGDLELKPNVLVKSDLASTQFDLNLNVMYRKLVWVGVTYRLKDAVAPLIGIQKEVGPGMLKFGYSYDVTTSDINNYSNGSHEIMLNYCFNISINRPFERSVHPRFL